MKLPVKLAVLSLFASLFASCTPSTPEARIEESPARYGSLTSKDKAMVAQGKIRTGMTQDAVYLSWGKPHSVSKGGSGNASTERWTYTAQTPVWTNNVNIGFGSGYSRYGSCDHGGFYDYGPTITYVPYTAGVVHFTNDRVSKWEDGGR
ncbi:MAG: outer membrane protein assembly factor BamE (lipoprotein component of BamABCDE complex) [Verrucomicrobiales bacterium]|jgi:outer membrane protein assembly factor BamE (lipoprotein component of BamABCDE complex)